MNFWVKSIEHSGCHSSLPHDVIAFKCVNPLVDFSPAAQSVKNNFLTHRAHF